MVTSAHESQNPGQQYDPEPWAETPNAMRNALIELGDLASENQALHERAIALFCRLKEVCAARGLPPPKLEDN